MTLFRIVFPASIAVVGVVLIVVVGSDAAIGAGIVLIGVAGLVALAHAFIRLSIESQRDREREEERRRQR
jgi:ABC-type transport system involved in cytochrome bd biosynthesis fused ATPase/permease subunit